MNDVRSVDIYIGTKRGLFIARSDAAREHWHILPPRLAGYEVYHVSVDPRTGVVRAATNHRVWGSHIQHSDDRGETWNVPGSSPHHEDERGVHAVWCVTPGEATRPGRLWAGIEPAGLFVSDDDGASWTPSSLNRHPTTSMWQPAGGALALHSLSIDPTNADRMWCAVSAGGVYRSIDGGRTWDAINAGVRADFLPGRLPQAGHCVHKLRVHPARPDRLYQQNHCGTYRSDDGGSSWIEITSNLPTDYGYVLAIDPSDPDVACVIPEESSHMRTTAGGMLRVFRTRDAGASWQPLTDGLPQTNAYVSLLREGMDNDTLDPVGYYFGTSGGHVFASRDRGDTWTVIAEWLPRVISIAAHVVAPVQATADPPVTA
jgi:photosystem II stability/assembly factor-like uncharacterized protein